MEIDLEALLKDEGDQWVEKARSTLTLLASLASLEAGRALMAVLQKALDRSHREIDVAPERDDKQLRRDLVFKLGGHDTARALLALPDQARRVLEAIDEKVQ